VSFDVGFIIEKLPYLLSGLKWTLFVSITSLIFSFVIGIIGATIRTRKIPVISEIVSIYVEVIRNTPLLVQIFLLFFSLPSIGVTLSPFVTGVIALSIWGGAYSIENFRAGMEAVSKNYIEAGESLGMSKGKVFRYIIIPIGLRTSFSSFSNTAISVIKNSSYLTGIGLMELTFTALDTISIYFKTFEMFFAIGVIYLGLIWIVSKLFRFIESKLDYNRVEPKKPPVYRRIFSEKNGNKI
jgi:His/Glu/Gln/Arg/opine family amino acid ABC transporter permease subunit